MTKRGTGRRVCSSDEKKKKKKKKAYGEIAVIYWAYDRDGNETVWFDYKKVEESKEEEKNKCRKMCVLVYPALIPT